jgi:medium-chain acyl-[acyl-carrier-protein] hydrolase
MVDAKPIYEQELRINAFECDYTHYWKPSAAYQHLTEIAGIHAEYLGVGYEAMLKKNYFWVLSRMKIQFHQYPKHGEIIRVRTWPKTIQQKLFFIRDFEVENLAGQLLASASSAWLVIDTKTRRMIPTTRLDLDLPNIPDRRAIDEPLDKITVPEKTVEQFHATADYSDLDILGHVNNGRYVEWIADSFDLEVYKSKRPASIQVNYISEVKPAEKVSIRTANSNDSCSVIEGLNLNQNTRAFEAQMEWMAKH